MPALTLDSAMSVPCAANVAVANAPRVSPDTEQQLYHPAFEVNAT